VTLSPGADVPQVVDGIPPHGPPVNVCLGAGEFRLRRFVGIRRDDVSLRGEGSATVLRLEAGIESPLVVVGDPDHETPRGVVSHVTIEDLRLVGSGRDGSELAPGRPYLTNSTIVIRGGRHVAIRRTVVTACRSACVLTERDSRDVSIEGNDLSGSAWDGVSLNRTSSTRVTGNTIHDNTAAGITTEHLVDSVIERNVVRGNRTHGLYLSDSYRNRIASNHFLENVLSGAFLTCAIRERVPPVRCWNDSMSRQNVFAGDRFVHNRVGFMVAADDAANCARRAFSPNLSRGDVFSQNPKEDPRAGRFGRCLVYAESARPRRRGDRRDRAVSRRRAPRG
jgi:parallel beta-helix repeat protein